MNKLPQITVAFWIMKICATTLGETAGDLLADNLGLGFIGGSILIGGLLVMVVLGYYLTKISRVILF